jgi:hypothetical protein
MSLKTVAWISGVYDLALAVAMLLFASRTAALFGAPPPVPLVNAQLNGVFTLALAAGYFWAAGDVEARRGYFWIAGVLAKGLGAALFVVDYLRGNSPASFLLFVLSDGTLALLTLGLLLRTRESGRVSTPAPRPASGTPRG